LIIFFFGHKQNLAVILFCSVTYGLTNKLQGISEKIKIPPLSGIFYNELLIVIVLELCIGYGAAKRFPYLKIIALAFALATLFFLGTLPVSRLF